MNARPDPYTIIAALREENEMLQELVRQLREDLAPRPTFPAAWRLSGQQATILSCAMAASPGIATHSRLMSALFGDRDIPDYGLNQIHVQAARLRRRLAAAGIDVVLRSVREEGYQISAADRGSLLAAQSCDMDRRAA